MIDQLSVARRSVQRASETTDNAVVREQLASIDEGLMELTDGQTTQDTDPGMEVERLTPIEEKLTGLLDTASGDTETQIAEARDAIDIFRQEHTEWNAEE
ncbi:DUF7553 family protein [Halocatena pleomorpha]|uniref:Uncharacterized protein n=1 Tax=Halocatena pleomorpha TaxID=1785090 RepID=A0A3P3RJU5_9EURY|nr:hypothetical protein [Halocatena pleomorpha]RRJ33781.1 hypothetical protein EIK79_03060 [Halocatena pleomorpha]